MGRRKLRVYGDADLDSELEEHLRNHKWVNYVGARELGFSEHDDDHQYQEAHKQYRVLVSHDDGYLNNSRYPLHETRGVIVIKRGESKEAQVVAFETFLRWVWAPDFRDAMSWSDLGCAKVEISRDGFHYWGRKIEGKDDEGYERYQ